MERVVGEVTNLTDRMSQEYYIDGTASKRVFVSVRRVRVLLQRVCWHEVSFTLAHDDPLSRVLDSSLILTFRDAFADRKACKPRSLKRADSRDLRK